MAWLNEAVETWGSVVPCTVRGRGMGLLVVMATDGGVVWASGSQIFFPHSPPRISKVKLEFVVESM